MLQNVAQKYVLVRILYDVTRIFQCSYLGGCVRYNCLQFKKIRNIYKCTNKCKVIERKTSWAYVLANK